MYKTLFKQRKTFTDVTLFLRIRKIDNADFYQIKNFLDNINIKDTHYAKDHISVELTNNISDDSNISMKLTDINEIREVFSQLDNSFKN